MCGRGGASLVTHMSDTDMCGFEVDVRRWRFAKLCGKKLVVLASTSPPPSPPVDSSTEHCSGVRRLRVGFCVRLRGGSWYYDRGCLFQGRRYADLLYTCGKSMAAAPQPYADSFFSSASVCARSRYTLAENPSVPLPGLTRIPTPIPYTLAENLSVAFLILTPIPSSLAGRFRPLLFNP